MIDSEAKENDRNDFIAKILESKGNKLKIKQEKENLIPEKMLGRLIFLFKMKKFFLFQ